MKVNVIGGEISEKEKELYIKHVTCRTTQPISEITIELDGEFVNLTWHYQDVPFQRIRRITGYLVGTLDRFNDGKRAEEADRVHHGFDDEYYQHDLSGLMEV